MDIKINKTKGTYVSQCVICNYFGFKYNRGSKENEYIQLTDEQFDKLQEVSKKRNDTMSKYLKELTDKVFYAHSSCRNKYTCPQLVNLAYLEWKNKNNSKSTPIKLENNQNSNNLTPKITVISLDNDDDNDVVDVNNESFNAAEQHVVKKIKYSDVEVNDNFEYKKNCIFCTDLITNASIKNDPVYRVQDPNFQSCICNILANMNNQTDEINRTRQRFSKENDLIKLGAIYHKKCYNALTLSAKPSASVNISRPLIKKIDASMNKVYEYIEDADEEDEEFEITFDNIKDLLDKDDYLPNTLTIFKSLKNRYGEGNVTYTKELKQYKIKKIIEEVLLDDFNDDGS